MISIIAATDNENAIGKDNAMPWHLSDDLKHFKSITIGHTVIMGKNTWLSLPFKPLKGRRNIVISRSMPKTEECEIVRSTEEALKLIAKDEQAYIMGGASIYKQMIDKADELLITRIYETFENTDTYFPKIEEKEWKIYSQSEKLFDETSKLEYQYITYRRKQL